MSAEELYDWAIQGLRGITRKIGDWSAKEKNMTSQQAAALLAVADELRHIAASARPAEKS